MFAAFALLKVSFHGQKIFHTENHLFRGHWINGANHRISEPFPLDK